MKPCKAYFLSLFYVEEREHVCVNVPCPYWLRELQITWILLRVREEKTTTQRNRAA